MIGKIQRARLRDVWPNEALDFTPWLQENIDELGDITGLRLTAVEREQSAGSFNVDLVADSDSGLVIVENQLERSDHDHLGKVLTYLAQLGASTAVWVVSEPRPEHVTAISWLNDSSSASFYLVKLEAVKIGDSPPAALFTLITGPSEEATRASETKRELAGREKARIQFWTMLLERSKSRTKLHSGLSPNKYSWLGSGAGLPAGLGLNYSIRTNDSRVELYIDSGRDSDDSNLERYQKLLANKEQIETDFDGSLIWEELDGRRACRIGSRSEIAGWKNEDHWEEACDDMIDQMIRLEKALRPHFSTI